MISDYYSFIFGGGLFALAYFYINPESIKTISTNISWYSVRSYHTLNLYWSDYNKSNVVEKIEYKSEEEEINKINLEGINGDGEFEYFEIEENENMTNEELSDFKILFVEHEEDGKIYYENISNDINIESLFERGVEPVKRQFLQIELEQGDEKVDIHEHISKYYVKNNALFSKIFMEYYMEKYYENPVKDGYKINIIDKDITLLSIDETQKVVLTENGYKIN
jgi:hypothetical protein